MRKSTKLTKKGKTTIHKIKSLSQHESRDASKSTIKLRTSSSRNKQKKIQKQLGSYNTPGEKEADNSTGKETVSKLRSGRFFNINLETDMELIRNLEQEREESKREEQFESELLDMNDILLAGQQSLRPTVPQLQALLKSKGVEPLKSWRKNKLENEWEKVKDNEDWERKVFWMESVGGAMLDDACQRMEVENLDQLEDEYLEV